MGGVSISSVSLLFVSSVVFGSTHSANELLTDSQEVPINCIVNGKTVPSLVRPVNDCLCRS